MQRITHMGLKLTVTFFDLILALPTAILMPMKDVSWLGILEYFDWAWATCSSFNYPGARNDLTRAPDPTCRWVGVPVASFSPRAICQTTGPILDPKKAFDSPGPEISEYVATFYLNVTDDVTGLVKDQLFDFCHCWLPGQTSRRSSLKFWVFLGGIHVFGSDFRQERKKWPWKSFWTAQIEQILKMRKLSKSL